MCRGSPLYCPLMKLREGKVLVMCVCQYVCSQVVPLWSLPMMHWTSLYRPPPLCTGPWPHPTHRYRAHFPTVFKLLIFYFSFLADRFRMLRTMSETVTCILLEWFRIVTYFTWLMGMPACYFHFHDFLRLYLHQNNCRRLNDHQNTSNESRLIYFSMLGIGQNHSYIVYVCVCNLSAFTEFRPKWYRYWFK